MKMSLEEWDKRIAPPLANIELKARQISSDAQQLIEYVAMLPAVPEFETRAIEQAVIAKKILDDAIALYYSKEKVK